MRDEGVGKITPVSIIDNGAFYRFSIFKLHFDRVEQFIERVSNYRRSQAVRALQYPHGFQAHDTVDPSRLPAGTMRRDIFLGLALLRGIVTREQSHDGIRVKRDTHGFCEVRARMAAFISSTLIVRFAFGIT